MTLNFWRNLRCILSGVRLGCTCCCWWWFRVWNLCLLLHSESEHTKNTRSHNSARMLIQNSNSHESNSQCKTRDGNIFVPVFEYHFYTFLVTCVSNTNITYRTSHTIITLALPHHPKFQHVCFSTTLNRLVSRIHLGKEFVRLKQVSCTGRVGTFQHSLMMCQKHRALKWCTAHLVWIPRHGIS